MERGLSPNPRRRHEECRRAAYFTAAAIRALRALPPAAQAQARRRLIAAANQLASRWQRPRDTTGRWLPASAAERAREESR